MELLSYRLEIVVVSGSAAEAVATRSSEPRIAVANRLNIEPSLTPFRTIRNLEGYGRQWLVVCRWLADEWSGFRIVRRRFGSSPGSLEWTRRP